MRLPGELQCGVDARRTEDSGLGAAVAAVSGFNAIGVRE